MSMMIRGFCAKDETRCFQLWKWAIKQCLYEEPILEPCEGSDSIYYPPLLFESEKNQEVDRLDEIIMGENTIISIGEKRV